MAEKYNLLDEVKLSRRTFTKATVALGAMAATGVGLQRYTDSTRYIDKLVETASAGESGGELIKTICSHCAVGCGLRGKVESGVLTGIEPWGITR